MMLIDLRNKNINGKDAEELLGEIQVIVNKNMVPFDTESPFVTSGIRIGTAAITTRGFKEDHMIKIVDIIDRCISNRDQSNLEDLTQEVMLLTKGHPLFKISEK